MEVCSSGERRERARDAFCQTIHFSFIHGDLFSCLAGCGAGREREREG